MKSWTKLLAWPMLMALVGCGSSGPETFPVAGQVRFKGQALPTGTLTLIPKSSKGRTAVTKIVDGNYATEVTAGDWTVNIQAVRETGPVIEALGEAPREQYLPGKYNGESKLTITVPSDQPEFSFDLDP
jgi:hypothetical protein